MPEEGQGVQAELLDFLANYHPQCSDCPDGDATCITLKNATGKELRIIFEDEITVTYDCWHDHYWVYADSDEFEILKKNVCQLLQNELYIFSVFLQDRWIGTMLWDGPLTRAEVKRQIGGFLKADKNWVRQAKTYGVEARIVYWEETKNQTVVFAPGEYS